MKYRQLGQTGITVSEIGMGCLPLDGMSYGPLSEPEALTVIHSAIAAGCTVFNTGPAWREGESERRLGTALITERREAFCLISRGGVGADASSAHLAGGQTGTSDFSQAALERTLKDSLERLKTDYLDCFLLQTPSLGLIQGGQIFEILQRWKTRGDIRSYGLSIHDPMEGILAMSHAQVDCIEVAYHFFDRRPEQLHAGQSLLSRCLAERVGVIVREPLANGFLGGQFHSGASPDFAPEDCRRKWPALYLKKRIAAAEAYQALLTQAVFCESIPVDALPVSLPQLALCFALRHPAVSTVVPGIRTEAQLKENLAASDLPSLENGFDALLEALAERVF